jgi:dUTP pyrophosphatase
MIVEIKRISQEYNDIPLPTYATSGSAGMDIYAAMDEEIAISAGKVAMIPTNLSIALQTGYECQVRSRSGLAAKSGIFCLNSPGTIDSDYRGEIKVIIANFGKDTFVVKSGDRIAQLVIAKYEHITWNEKETLSETDRGTGGFGSTGV